MGLSWVAQYTLTAATLAELNEAVAHLQTNPAVSGISVKTSQRRVTFTLTAIAPPIVVVTT